MHPVAAKDADCETLRESAGLVKSPIPAMTSPCKKFFYLQCLIYYTILFCGSRIICQEKKFVFLL